MFNSFLIACVVNCVMVPRKSHNTCIIHHFWISPTFTSQHVLHSMSYSNISVQNRSIFLKQHMGLFSIQCLLLTNWTVLKCLLDKLDHTFISDKLDYNPEFDRLEYIPTFEKLVYTSAFDKEYYTPVIDKLDHTSTFDKLN